jgi:benzoylformate decarboxylase
VIGFSGDGGSLYTIQALWTAARYDIGAKFIICNNGDYLLLKLNLMQYWSERGIEPHEFPASFELNDPPIQFDQLARGFGVPGVRIETPDQCGPAIRQALEHSGPFLIDMVVSNDAGRHFKHLPGHPRYTHARGQ